jgi:hypothetical protein
MEKWSGTARHDIVRHDTTLSGTTRHRPARHDTTPFDSKELLTHKVGHCLVVPDGEIRNSSNFTVRRDLLSGISCRTWKNNIFVQIGLKGSML